MVKKHDQELKKCRDEHCMIQAEIDGQTDRQRGCTGSKRAKIRELPIHFNIEAK